MTNEMALWFALGSSVLAVIYGLVMTTWVLGKPAGNEKMQEIAAAIQVGAKAYMNRQYTAIGIVAGCSTGRLPSVLRLAPCFRH